MKSPLAFVASLAGFVLFAFAEVGIYGQCGGVGYEGATVCVSGTVCTTVNEAYSWCSSLPTIRANDPAIGYGACTTGGAGGSTVRVSTLAGLKSAVAGNSKKTVILTASLKGKDVVNIGSNTSLLGANGGITLDGIGLRILGVSNVIVRNLKITKVLASAGDAIGVQASSSVWIDHVDLSSDLKHGKDYYDGLLDITHGCTNVTVSWSYLHDHYKASLVGCSDDNTEDKVATVTFHHNYFARLNSRTPSLRFGTSHIYNNYFGNIHLGIDTRKGAQILMENNVFVDSTKPLYSEDGLGYAIFRGNDFGGAGTDRVRAGSLSSVPYNYSLRPASAVKSDVPSGAGANLYF